MLLLLERGRWRSKGFGALGSVDTTGDSWGCFRHDEDEEVVDLWREVEGQWQERVGVGKSGAGGGSEGGGKEEENWNAAARRMKAGCTSVHTAQATKHPRATHIF